MPDKLQQLTIKLPPTLLQKIDNISLKRQGRIDRSTTIRQLLKETTDDKKE